MSKDRESPKEIKKKPAMSLKEKRAAKRAKRESRPAFPQSMADKK